MEYLGSFELYLASTSSLWITDEINVSEGNRERENKDTSNKWNGMEGYLTVEVYIVVVIMILGVVLRDDDFERL